MKFKVNDIYINNCSYLKIIEIKDNENILIKVANSNIFIINKKEIEYIIKKNKMHLKNQFNMNEKQKYIYDNARYELMMMEEEKSENLNTIRFIEYNLKQIKENGFSTTIFKDVIKFFEKMNFKIEKISSLETKITF